MEVAIFSDHNQLSLILVIVNVSSFTVETALEYERDQPYYEDGKVMEKDAALHLALSRLAGDFGKESMLSLQRFYGSRYAPVISTGSLKLDLSLGIGGLPKVTTTKQPNPL